MRLAEAAQSGGALANRRVQPTAPSLCSARLRVMRKPLGGYVMKKIFFAILTAFLLSSLVGTSPTMSQSSSYICGYSTDGVLQSGMTGYSYSYIVECSTGDAIGWNRAGFGLQQYVRIYNPIIVDISPIQLNDGTIISKEITDWSAIAGLGDIGDSCSLCDPNPTPAAVVEVCGQLIPPPPSNCPPDTGGCGWGEIFIPYGSENNPNEWMMFHPLGVYVRSENDFYFLGDLVGYNQFVRLVLPESELANPSYLTVIEGYEGYQIVAVSTIERYEIVDSCGPPPTPTPSSVPTPVPTPTPLPTPASPMLEVIDFEVPSQASVYEEVRIKTVIENKGAPLNQPYWGYSGEVALEDGNGNIVERHSFAKGDASFISPVIENGQVNFKKWLLTVKVRFGTAVSNGKVIVSIQPDGQQSVLRGEGALTVNVGISGLTCTSVVVNKLVGPFSSEAQQDLLNAISAELQAFGCKDGDFVCAAPPLVKGFVKVLGRAILDQIGKIIIGIWGLFDTDALQVCKDPVGWMWQFVREFNRQGVSISVSGSHSPVLILVTNSAGQRAGFVSEDEIVTELPNSQVVEWEGDKYVIYPADNNITISLRGTGNGTASLSLIDGQSGREVSYSSISVSDGTNAQLDLSDQQFRLVVDNNGDGNIDEVHTPESVEVLTQIETPTASSLPVKQPTGICGGTLGLTVLPFLALVVRRFRKGAK